jgi:hypothetical protein
MGEDMLLKGILDIKLYNGGKNINKIIPLSMIGILIISGVGIVAGEITSNPTIDSPYGPSVGYVGLNYTFYFIIPFEIPGSDFIINWWWGDGNVSGWLGPYHSFTIVNASHTFDQVGEYEIRVMLKDVYGSSYSSDPWKITIFPGTILNISNISGFFWKIGFQITNIGQYNATNITWKIHTQKGAGGSPLFGQGNISILPPGARISVDTIRPFFGFGVYKIIINVKGENAPSIEKRTKAFVLGFFILHIQK